MARIDRSRHRSSKKGLQSFRGGRMPHRSLHPLRRINISECKKTNPALVVAFKGWIPVTEPYKLPLFVGGERLRDTDGKPYSHNCFPYLEYTHAIRIFYIGKELDSKQQPRTVTVCVFHGCFDLLHATSWGEHPDSALIRLIHALCKVLSRPDFPKRMIFRSREPQEKARIEGEWTRLVYRLCDRLFKPKELIL